MNQLSIQFSVSNLARGVRTQRTSHKTKPEKSNFLGLDFWNNFRTSKSASLIETFEGSFLNSCTSLLSDPFAIIWISNSFNEPLIFNLLNFLILKQCPTFLA